MLGHAENAIATCDTEFNCGHSTVAEAFGLQCCVIKAHRVMRSIERTNPQTRFE